MNKSLIALLAFIAGVMVGYGWCVSHRPLKQSAPTTYGSIDVYDATDIPDKYKGLTDYNKKY